MPKPKATPANVAQLCRVAPLSQRAWRMSMTPVAAAIVQTSAASSSAPGRC
ncbi:hypothetical protein [Novosphingobium clariflavum]|uniref:Uncharacterized protein n=1 Tax=Novosphingobium clariflavum TaxID=2029884 RepID=A0ABV6S862_9SPHN|nr:hypothetical protein [Novosphingobium clariflavum]